MGSPNPKFADIIAEIKRICSELGLDPLELSKAKFLAHAVIPITGRQLDRLGGFRSLLFDYFGKDTERDLAVIQGTAQKRRYINKLEKIVGAQEFFYSKLSKIICSELDRFKFPVMDKIQKPVLKVEGREVVAFISDTHFGLDINSEEMGGVNCYNWEVAARRMGLFATQVATFKKETRDQTPRLRICLGGDLAQGLIHLSDAGTDLITHQVIGTVHILYQFIAYLRHFFKEIVVECTTDNHLRMVHKGADRATSQKYDSYATFIHHALAMGFRHCKDVSFNIPKTPYTVFNVLGNNFYLTHGDTLINIGRPGKLIRTSDITDAMNRLNSTLKDNDSYKVIMMGHVHTACFITLDNGCEGVINGTGSGLDPYAQSIGIFQSNPTQVMFEATTKFPVGDQRKIYLGNADKDAKYEKIIRPYNYELVPIYVEGLS